MPKSLFFTKGTSETFWRCGHCGQDFNARTDAGQHLRLANILLAMICSECVNPITAKLSDLAPRSFPDCDGAGRLLGDS